LWKIGGLDDGLKIRKLRLILVIESLQLVLFPNKKLPSFVRDTPAQGLVVADEIGK
jgi:hypothetical protein